MNSIQTHKGQIPFGLCHDITTRQIQQGIVRDVREVGNDTNHMFLAVISFQCRFLDTHKICKFHTDIKQHCDMARSSLLYIHVHVTVHVRDSSNFWYSQRLKVYDSCRFRAKTTRQLYDSFFLFSYVLLNTENPISGVPL